MTIANDPEHFLQRMAETLAQQHPLEIIIDIGNLVGNLREPISSATGRASKDEPLTSGAIRIRNRPFGCQPEFRLFEGPD